MSEEQVFRPMPGRDAMTRDGRRATVIHRLERADIWPLGGTVDGEWVTWTDLGRQYGKAVESPRDLVSDWPDANPLPDADGVRPAPSGPVVEETIKRIVPGVYGRVWVGSSMSGLQSVAFSAFDDRFGEAVALTRSEVLAAAETLRQIGEAMEGK